MTTTGIEQAIATAGGPSKLARHLGVSRQRVQGWARKGYVPRKWVLEIEAEFGIPRRELLEPGLAALLSEPME